MLSGNYATRSGERPSGGWRLAESDDSTKCITRPTRGERLRDFKTTRRLMSPTLWFSSVQKDKENRVVVRGGLLLLPPPPPFLQQTHCQIIYKKIEDVTFYSPPRIFFSWEEKGLEQLYVIHLLRVNLAGIQRKGWEMTASLMRFQPKSSHPPPPPRSADTGGINYLPLLFLVIFYFIYLFQVGFLLDERSQ